MSDTVVLLHGILRTSYSMSYLASTLHRKGYAVLNYGYESRKYSLEEQADRLNDFLSTRHDRRMPLNFVTHSLGSIVARQFALKYHDGYSLNRAVMLGPPNQGSQLASTINKLGFPAMILGPAFVELCDLDLAPASDRLEIGIIAGGVQNDRGISPAVTGDNDGIVSVNETMLEGAKDFIIIPGLHSFLMYSRPVLKQVAHFLQNGEFDR